MVGKQYEGQAVGGEFRLLRCLGGDESSGVFLAVQPGGEPARVALKLVRANAPGAPLALERWTAAAKLSHPHLIRLFRTGRCRLGDADFVYAVMEYADENLSHVLPDRPLTAAEARETLIPVLDALRYLHAQGFVHGSLKPANILATRDQLKLSSDSIRRMGEPGASALRRGTYDPPEFGTKDASAPPADVWSLGVTLVEALTRRLPSWSVGPQPELILPKPLPEPFAEIAYRSLARDPLRRWTLGDILGSIQGERVAVDAPAGEPSKRRLRWAWIAAGLTVVTVLAGYQLLFRGPRSEPASPVAESQSAPPATTPQSRPSPAGRPSLPPPAATPAGTAVPEASPTPDAVPSTDGIVTQVLPDIPRAAQDTVQGAFGVDIRVSVDAAGNVSDAALMSPGPSRYFAALALDAARQWKFVPATQEGGAASVREWMLQFRFDRFSARVIPAEIHP